MTQTHEQKQEELEEAFDTPVDDERVDVIDPEVEDSDEETDEEAAKAQKELEATMSGFNESISELTEMRDQYDGLEYLFPDELLNRYERRQLKKKQRAAEKKRRMKAYKNKRLGIDSTESAEEEQLREAISKADITSPLFKGYSGPLKITKK